MKRFLIMFLALFVMIGLTIAVVQPRKVEKFMLEGNGTSQYVQFNDVTGLTGLPAKTFTFWINQDSYIASTNPVYLVGDDNTDELNILTVNFAGNNGWIMFSAGFTTTQGIWAVQSNVVPINGWHHVAVAYDGSSTSNNPAIYVDGVAKSVTRLQAPIGTWISTGANKLRVLGTTANSVDGKMENWKIYNRVLSAGEVAEIYNSRTVTVNDVGLLFDFYSIGAAGYSEFNGAALSESNFLIDRMSGRRGVPHGGPGMWGDTLLAYGGW